MNEFEQNETFLGDRRIINLALFLIVILSIVFLVSLYASRGIRDYEKRNVAEKQKINPFENVYIEGQSAFAYDIYNKRVIFEKNPDSVRPLASITKVLSVLTAIDLLPTNTTVTVDSKFLKEEGDSGLYGNEKWEINDLIDFSLTTSSNDGIAAIAGAAGALSSNASVSKQDAEDFIVKMNEKALSIGMNSSVFFNETGLDLSKEKSGAYSTARDTANLFAYALKEHPEIFYATKEEKITLKSLDNITHKAKNTNTETNLIPNLIASKTGFTDLAGGNLAVVFDAGINRPIVIVVLGSSEEGRFRDVSTIAWKTLEAINNQ